MPKTKRLPVSERILGAGETFLYGINAALQKLVYEETEI